MNNNVILLIHPALGGNCHSCGTLGFWGHLECQGSVSVRQKNINILWAVLMWLTYIIGGYWWYIVHYAREKAIIKAGP